MIAGTGPIWLDNVNCGLVANRLIDCPRGNAIGVHNCDHTKDIGVRCEPLGYRGTYLILKNPPCVNTHFISYRCMYNWSGQTAGWKQPTCGSCGDVLLQLMGYYL